MDLPTIQAIADIVNHIGLPATLGVISLLAAYNLLPVLADWLRSKIEINKASAFTVRNGKGNPSQVP
jgi:hypothetical protein